MGFPGGSDGKESASNCRRPRFDPWVRKLPWRREWLPTPVFLPEEFHGERSLAGHSLRDHKGSNMAEPLTLSLLSWWFCLSFWGLTSLLLFSQQLYHFPFPPTMYKIPFLYILPKTRYFLFASLKMKASLMGRRCYHSFNLHFPSDHWHWASLQVLWIMCYLDIFLGEVSIWVLWPFFKKS